MTTLAVFWLLSGVLNGATALLPTYARDVLFSTLRDVERLE